MTYQTTTLDYDELEDKIETVWELLEARKYQMAREVCQVFLRAIEHDLGDDFGQDLATATLYDDTHEDRRESYLALLRAYQQALRHVVLELLMNLKNSKDIDGSYPMYQSLRREIEKEISTAAFLFGEQAVPSTFLTDDDLREFDASLRDRCRFVLQDEFLHTFSIVVQTLGNLDRKDFHLITEPYRDLRVVCNESLKILEIMQDERFFGKEDGGIKHYVQDVKRYLQILWYLAIKSDLNKIAKFLDPNTYSKGMDQFCQVFASLSLLEEILPHLEAARAVGLSDLAAAELLEDYTEYWYVVIQHEEITLRQTELYQILETGRIMADGYSLEEHTFDLKAAEADREYIAGYRPVETCLSRYAEQIQQESNKYLRPANIQEFHDIVVQAAIGIGLKEEATAETSPQSDQPIQRRTAYRYEYCEGERIRLPAVLVMNPPSPQSGEIRVLHEKWVERLYKAWKHWKRLQYLKILLDRHTVRQTKTKYRIDFPLIFLRGTPFAFRLGEYDLIAEENPDGRKLRPDTPIAEALDTLKSPLFSQLTAELKLQYRSQDAVKLQGLRWAWFAQRELPDGYFERPKYDYLKYVETCWLEKRQEHERALQKILSTPLGSHTK